MKERLIIISFAFIVIIIIAGGYFAYTLQKSSIINSRYNEISAIRELKAKQIVDWQKERIGDAKAILHNPLLVDELKHYLSTRDSGTESAILTWFAILKESYDYSEIILTDKDFNKLLSSEKQTDISLDNLHIQEYNLFDDEREVVISPIHKDKFNKPHYTMRLNFRSGKEIILRILIVVDPTKFLFPLIQAWPTPSITAESILVRDEGDSVLFINELRHHPNSALDLKISKERVGLTATEAVSGRTGMFRGYDYRNVKVLSDIGPIPNSKLYLIAKIDEAEIFAELTNSLIVSVIIVLLMIVISYLVFIYVLRNSKVIAMEKELKLQEEKVRMTNLYATLSQINQAIVRESSKAELILKITSFPVNFGNFKAAAISIFDEDSNKLKVESFYGELDYFHAILNDDSSYKLFDPGYQAYINQATTVRNNFESVNQKWSSAALNSGIKSCASSTIKVFKKTIGSISLYSEKENCFFEKEINLIKEIATDIAFAFEVFEKNNKRKEIESKLVENERMLSTLFSNLPGIAYRCKFDEDYTMEFMSDHTLELTGYKVEEIIDKRNISYEEIIFPEDREFVRAMISHAVDNKEDFTITYRIKPKSDKEFKWVWERGTPVFDTQGKLIALEGFISDITEAKAAEEKLIEAKNTAENADKLKTDFLAQMSHEIRTPVNVILSFNSLIKDAVIDSLSEDMKESFHSIESASKRLIRTIDSILNMAQITRDSFEMNVEKVDLVDDVIEKVHYEFSSLAKQKGLEFDIVNNCEDATVLVDTYSVSQLFSNLVDNAIKYTGEGSIKILLDCNEKGVTVKVSDTGIGMSEDFLPNLFSPFIQEDSGYSRKYEGTGLGLALVKNYCDMNHAEISVSSKKGVGSTFTVTFPKNTL